MTRNKTIPINLINITLIIMIMTVVALLTQSIIHELTLKDIQNVTRLTMTNIYAEISKELIEPVATAKIMSQNTFMYEVMAGDDESEEEKIAEYLTAIQDSTGYESVFLVPHSSLNYYHPGGTDAKVDLTSDNSLWYQKQMASDDDYTVVINAEQLDNWALTAYVNASIKDREGNFLGVTGVGKRVLHVQDILVSYLMNQGVEAYLIDEEGVIQIHHDKALIKAATVFQLEGITKNSLQLDMLGKESFEKEMGEEFIIIQGMPLFDMFLVVRKSTSNLTPALNEYSIKMYVALALSVLMMMFATRFTIARYRKQLIRLSNKDQLTSIPNRTIFESVLGEAISNMNKSKFTLAFFDLDNLKHINDKLGHDQGDVALRAVAEIASMHIPEPNLVARIGGDEFAVIMYRPIEEGKALIESFFKAVQDDSTMNRLDATVSIGITESRITDTESSIYKRADEALYESKKTGKNNIKFSKK